MSPHGEHFKSYLVRWNNRFPFDRLYRKKYNIGFGSEQHRALNPVDMYFDYLEEVIVEESRQHWEEVDERAKLYAEGIWLKDQPISEEQEDDLFNRIDLGQINKAIQ